MRYDLQFFGGRGASAGTTGGRKAKLGDFFKPKANDTDSLDSEKIKRANSASVMDIGDIINRTYQRGKEEISTMEFSDAEKKDAVSKLKQLSNNALDSAANAVNPYVSGRSRLTRSQMTGSAADKASSDRSKIDSYMNSLRQRSKENAKKKSNVSLAQQLQRAQAEGRMEITINGKRYYRKSKRGSNWYA